MKDLNKKIIVPIITAIALLIKYTMGFEIPDVAVDLAADLIMGGITLVGIFMNPKKEGGSPDESAQHYTGGGPSV